MADYRLRLSDATTTITLWEDADNNYKIRPRGLSMPAPAVKASYVSNPFLDGGKLAAASYDNRVITMVLHLMGTSHTDLKSRIRAIQRRLNDAEKRTLLGYGDLVYLEYQWGDTDGESIYFDVLRGDFQMVSDFSIRMLDNFFVIDAPLTLVCKPFGRYANQDFTQTVLENYSYATDNAYNYMDIVTAEAYGDQPAKMYIKLVMANCAGTKKLWVAKRSGDRYNDILWREGEAETNTTDIKGVGVTFSDEAEAGLSAGNYKKLNFNSGGGSGGNEAIGRMNYNLTGPPRGKFRVLIYCRVDTEDAADFARISWGFGWSYGSKTHTPTEAAGEYYQCAANDTLEILDLGIIDIPPIAESEIAGISTFQLRIFQYATESLTINEDYDWEIDYIFLVPVDEGIVIIGSTVANATYAIDGITSPKNVYRISADKVSDYPSYVGAPFSLGRETTRIYMLRDDGKTVTFTTDVKYQPQFMVI